ncbi:HAD-IIB family hydrolase [Halomonas urumqiensis]|uniref:Mannosyl-3-phosphoglycerate phosphatase n=1 Tax=Halomonas urumqiensis TaxID=1684789 RepID=A0A2N7UDB3_9GAMM|nr:HAD-IIB family hydrolase [Halomonas urumqiensis]PMR78423.1 mannosyl-3-phosphoglycerate phosphatase [Halomonas urumqiensis]PTB03568.1 mannosyl-3-phosphoglycerate phosphatase [Halomonas urumqiensis]GHE20230.1 mannosyl-3-phosphoglycerate phosphatase [Halomonas urumqiensis]
MSSTDRPDSALTPRLLFTDLDGSLLDHHSYDWSPAAPWLARLKQLGVPVIPVTSKTRSEILPLRQALGLADTPFIAENGAVAGLPPAWCHARLDRGPGPDGLVIRTLGVDIGFIRKRISVWRTRLDARFTTMSEMSLDELSDFTGLSEAEARLARLREGSEPLIWDDNDERLAAFRQGLAGDGLCLVRGGRFWHVTGESHKGSAVAWLVERFQALRGQRPRTLALGDGPNDIAMLEAVDQAVVIRGCHGLDVTPHQSALYRSEATGPTGWAEGVSHWWGRADRRLTPAAHRLPTTSRTVTTVREVAA